MMREKLDALTGLRFIAAAMNRGLRNWCAGGDASAWHPHLAMRRVRLNDGSEMTGYVMRRWVAIGWQYRSMTADEERDEQSTAG